MIEALTVLTANNRAFKEWAVACDAMREGRQILMIRKGGIMEDGGAFTMSEREFFLMPTFEHQSEELLKRSVVPLLKARRQAPEPGEVLIDTYAVADTILAARNDDQVNAAGDEMIWNAKYVKQRFEFNPYDTLYLIIVRAYVLLDPVSLPLIREYTGCRSWVTLERSLATQGAVPALPDDAFHARKERLLAILNEHAD